MDTPAKSVLAAVDAVQDGGGRRNLARNVGSKDTRSEDWGAYMGGDYLDFDEL